MPRSLPFTHNLLIYLTSFKLVLYVCDAVTCQGSHSEANESLYVEPIQFDEYVFGVWWPDNRAVYIPPGV